MKCEKCQQNIATFFYQETINGKTQTMNLCHECAAAAGLLGTPKSAAEDGFSALFPNTFPNLLGDLLGEKRSAKSTAKTCDACGAAWADIAKAGKACCPHCYVVFADELSRTIRSIHGNVSHTGRVPAGLREQKEKEDKLNRLKSELKTAIETEDFEKAATLRDEIRALGNV